MKTVFSSNYDVAHAFSLPESIEGRTGNMFFHRDCIYSYGYHFCIAKKMRDGKVLFTYRTYSVSTAKHVSIVRSALSHMDFVYCCSPSESAAFNTQKFVELISSDFNQLKSSRGIKSVARRADKLRQSIDMYDKYIQYMNYTPDFDVSDIEFARAVLNSGDMHSKIADYRAELSRAEAKRMAEKQLQFESFEINQFSSEYQFVRYNKEKERFETSLRVEIPYAIAKVFWKLLKDGKIAKGDSILYYSVVSVNKYIIQIGCHKFNIKYLINFGSEHFK